MKRGRSAATSAKLSYSAKDHLDLQRFQEALCHGIVVRVAAPSYRAPDALLGEQLPVLLRSILAARSE
jgi:hypothetical protein